MLLTMALAAKWRKQAADLRATATALAELDVRAAVLRAAKGYDKMADDLERRLHRPDEQ